MPIERMAVDIFHKTAESYLKRAQECLAKLGTPESFTRVFLQPVTILHELGLQELKKSFEHHWKMNIYPQIETVLSKIQFNPEEKAIASLDEVNAILHSKSKFYNDIERMIAIFCYLKEGRWVPLDSNCVGLEASIYDQLNRITKVTHTLWDSEGVPKPLVVKISPIPFAETKGATTVPVKSCIMVGAQSIRGGN